MSFSQMYRPVGLRDLVFSSKVTAAIVQQYATSKRSGALILHGPHGTAKSTTAKIVHSERQVLQGIPPNRFVVNGSALGKSMESQMIGYLNAQLSNGEKMPCWLIDEIDETPKTYQARFQQFLDDHRHLAFAIMTTNHLSKVPSGLQSRAQICEMDYMPAGYWLPHLKSYLKSKGANKGQATLALLLSKSGPSIRDVEQLADTLAP
jgi:replication-associated recombination protein RarA